MEKTVILLSASLPSLHRVSLHVLLKIGDGNGLVVAPLITLIVSEGHFSLGSQLR